MAFLEVQREKLAAIQAAAAQAEEQAVVLAGVRKPMDGVEDLARTRPLTSSDLQEFGGTGSHTRAAAVEPEYRPRRDQYDRFINLRVRQFDHRRAQSAWDVATHLDGHLDSQLPHPV